MVKQAVVILAVLLMAATGYANPPKDCGDIGVCASFPDHPKVWVQDYWPDCTHPEECGQYPWCWQMRSCLGTDDHLPCCDDDNGGGKHETWGENDYDCRDCSQDQCEVDCEGVGHCPTLKDVGQCPHLEDVGVCPTCEEGGECPAVCPTCPACPDLESIGAICAAECQAVADACEVDVRAQLDVNNDGMLDLWTEAWVMDFAPSAMKQLFGKKFTKCRERGGGLLLSNQTLFGKPVLSARCVKAR
jgi:hypothetical protein